MFFEAYLAKNIPFIRIDTIPDNFRHYTLLARKMAYLSDQVADPRADEHHSNLYV